MNEFCDFNIISYVYRINNVMNEIKIFEITKIFNLMAEIIDFSPF